MNFNKWLLEESSLNDLHQSAVDAFPNTTLRQHATNPIVITELHWTPFKGMKTLFLKGLAQNGGKEYNPIIVFKGVDYHNAGGEGIVEITASDGQNYFLEKLSPATHDVLLRCNCPDFYWRFNYFDHVDKSLQGRKRKKYEALHNPGSANPQEMPGMCKHLMKMAITLERANLI